MNPVPASTRCRVHLFEWLERLSDARQRLRGAAQDDPRISNPSTPDGHRRGSVWVFVSTIGELNLAAPLLDRLVELLPSVPLTLLTDRPIYRDSYLDRYRDAHVHYLPQSGHGNAIRKLMQETPPLAMLVIEIPCLPSDGPCRLPYTALHPLRCAGVPTALVNGWLYGYHPASALDRLERRWFQQAYVDAFDLITLQSEETRERLIQSGASADRLHTTGNLKFDAVQATVSWAPDGRRSERLLRSLMDSGRPVVVAGCVTDDEDQELVVSAFARLLGRSANAALVIAPRHPEKLDRMQALASRLEKNQLTAVLRTRHGDMPFSPDLQCLVLDTFGELKDFYAVGTSTFVGRDHNLLEPLSFAKPVVTTGGWEPTYPSFPVFEQLRTSSSVDIVDDPGSLADVWTSHLESARHPEANLRADVRERLSRMAGATDRNLALLGRLFGALRPPSARPVESTPH